MANKRVSVKGKGADLFFGDYVAPPTDEEVVSPEPERAPAPASPNGSTAQSTDESTSQPTNRPTSKSTKRSTTKSISQPQQSSPSPSPIVNRPKAFYITERLDRRLDEAVRYFQRTHGIKKADRSILINAMLDNDEQWSNESLDLLIDRVISQLTSRLTGR